MLRGTNDVKIDLSRHRVIFLLPTRVIKLQKSDNGAPMFVTKTGLQGHVVAPRREKVPSATKTSAAAATPPTATTVQHLQSSG